MGNIVTTPSIFFNEDTDINSIEAHGSNESFESTMVSIIGKEVSSYYNSCMVDIMTNISLLESGQDLESKESKQRVMNGLSYGFRKTISAHSRFLFLLNEARNSTKKAEAIAMHHNFYNYIERQKEKGITVKTSDPYAKAYVNMDPDVEAARKKESMLESMCLELVGIKQEYSQGISTLKTIMNPYSEASQMSSAASAAINGKVDF